MMGRRQELLHEGSNEDAVSTLIRPVNRLKMSSQSDSEPDYRYEDVRLATFQPSGGNGNGWPCNDKVEARKVAKAGLYYTGRYTEAKCPWCDVVITNWDYGDQAMAKHRLKASQVDRSCPFVTGTSDNVPLLRMTPSPTPRDAMDQGSAEPSSSSSSEPAPNYLLESERMRSFETWPLSHVVPADLARSGFVYLNRGDQVKCVFCLNVIGHWAEDDFPDTEHRSLFPNCPFMLGQNVGNVPMEAPSYNPFSMTSNDFSAGPSASSVGASQSYDVAGIRAPPVNGPEKGPQVLRLMNVKGEPNAIGIVPHAAPANPKFVTVEARLNTFINWPSHPRQRPRELAEAGFFYVGSNDDRVKCFSCDGGLMNWQPEDDPWTEHARWFQKCGFLRMVKGDEFIAKCLGEKPPEPVPGLANFSPEEMTGNVPNVAEKQLDQMMASPLVIQVVAMGIATAKIRSALKTKLQMTGTGFKSASDLSEAAMNEAVSDKTSEPPSGGASAACASANQNEPPSISVLNAKEETLYSPTNVKESQQQKHLDVDLESENQRLKDQRTCKICFDEEIGVVFLPCGHLICCVKCAPSLKECPFCRQTISGTVKTYMS